jgi:transposase
MDFTARSAVLRFHPPERLLKAQLLIALYSVRSDRLFCEQLDYNILFRWFLDMSLQEASFADRGVGLDKVVSGQRRWRRI